MRCAAGGCLAREARAVRCSRRRSLSSPPRRRTRSSPSPGPASGRHSLGAPDRGRTPASTPPRAPADRLGRRHELGLAGGRARRRRLPDHEVIGCDRLERSADLGDGWRDHGGGSWLLTRRTAASAGTYGRLPNCPAPGDGWKSRGSVGGRLLWQSSCWARAIDGSEVQTSGAWSGARGFALRGPLRCARRCHAHARPLCSSSITNREPVVASNHATSRSGPRKRSTSRRTSAWSAGAIRDRDASRQTCRSTLR